MSGSESSNMDAPIGVGGTTSGSSPHHMQTPSKSRIPNRFFVSLTPDKTGKDRGLRLKYKSNNRMAKEKEMGKN